jgi:steroid delta-isomerase-like uncharacterized protein
MRDFLIMIRAILGRRRLGVTWLGATGSQGEIVMEQARMESLIEAHLRGEGNGDPETAVENYTEDIEHDVVGNPGGPVHGVPAALEFYRDLVKNFGTENEDRVRTYYAEDAITIENLMTGTVTGELLGFPGNGRRISFRTLHVFEFRDDRISRENIWLDGAAVAAQLTAP